MSKLSWLQISAGWRKRIQIWSQKFWIWMKLFSIWTWLLRAKQLRLKGFKILLKGGNKEEKLQLKREKLQLKMYWLIKWSKNNWKLLLNKLVKFLQLFLIRLETEIASILDYISEREKKFCCKLEAFKVSSVRLNSCFLKLEAISV